MIVYVKNPTAPIPGAWTTGQLAISDVHKLPIHDAIHVEINIALYILASPDALLSTFGVKNIIGLE